MPLNVRIDAPAGWSWSEDSKHRSPDQFHFIARRDAKTFFRLTVSGRHRHDNSEAAFGAFIESLRTANLRAGFALSDVRHEPHTVPAGQGFAYSYRMIKLKGGTVFADGFVLAADRLYILQYTSVDRSEQAAFQRFVASFGLMTPAR